MHQIDTQPRTRTTVKNTAEKLSQILAVVRLVDPDDRPVPYRLEEWTESQGTVIERYPRLWQWCNQSTDKDEYKGSSYYRYNLAVSWIEALRYAAQGEPVLQVLSIAIRDTETNRYRFDNKLQSLIADVEVDRLRECPRDKGGCGHIYYARRKDQGHCGNPQCKTRISSRKFYDKPEIKERLKQYYQAKKNKAKKKRAQTSERRLKRP